MKKLGLGVFLMSSSIILLLNLNVQWYLFILFNDLEGQGKLVVISFIIYFFGVAMIYSSRLSIKKYNIKALPLTVILLLFTLLFTTVWQIKQRNLVNHMLEATIAFAENCVADTSCNSLKGTNRNFEMYLSQLIWFASKKVRASDDYKKLQNLLVKAESGIANAELESIKHQAILDYLLDLGKETSKHDNEREFKEKKVRDAAKKYKESLLGESEFKAKRARAELGSELESVEPGHMESNEMQKYKELYESPMY